MSRYGCGYALWQHCCNGRPSGKFPSHGAAGGAAPFSRIFPIKRRRVIYEGKAKILYEGTEPGTVIQSFKDDATAGNGAKKDTI